MTEPIQFSTPPADQDDDRSELSRFEFLASHGGPFFELQRQLNLLHEGSLRSGRRMSLFVGIAWDVPLLLTLRTAFTAEPRLESYLTDPGPWARFVIAIAAFVAAEQAVESGLRRKLGQFSRAPLIAPGSMNDAMAAVSHALRQRDSVQAELVCLLLSILSALATFTTYSDVSTSTWATHLTTDGQRLTAAGWWCALVSIPLFVFLLLRGVWRHLIWASLLRRIARLELRLVATHPDGKGGLSFVSEYPNAYVLFVFGVSCGVAAAVAKHMAHDQLTATTLTTIMAVWLLIVFAYPLSAFSRPLFDLKDRTLRTLSSRATVQQRAAERKSLGRNVAAPDQKEADAVEAADPSKQYVQTRKLSSILINRNTLMPVAAAALVPFAIAGATGLPYKEVLSVVKKLLILQASGPFHR